MKCFIDDGNFLQDLKYENILKIVDETPLDPNENYDDVEGGEENKEGDDDAIEITNEEYLAKVKDIISRICKVILKEKKNVDEFLDEKIIEDNKKEENKKEEIKNEEINKEEINKEDNKKEDNKKEEIKKEEVKKEDNKIEENKKEENKQKDKKNKKQ